MTVKIVFLMVFVAGLALAVHSMLHGVERWRRKKSTRQSAVFNPPTVAALAVGIGASGYLLTTRTSLGAMSLIFLSVASGLVALGGMILLMAKWALRSPVARDRGDDEDIYGQVAIVTRTITPEAVGEIEYFAWERNHVLSASAIDSSIIPEGTEVVIDSMENGVAHVELWSVVEQRL